MAAHLPSDAPSTTRHVPLRPGRLARRRRSADERFRQAARHKLDASAMVAAFRWPGPPGAQKISTLHGPRCRRRQRYRRIPQEDEIVAVLATPSGPERNATLLRRCAELAPGAQADTGEADHPRRREDPIARAFQDRAIVDALVTTNALGILAGTHRLAIDERRSHRPAGALRARPLRPGGCLDRRPGGRRERR